MQRQPFDLPTHQASQTVYVLDPLVQTFFCSPVAERVQLVERAVHRSIRLIPHAQMPRDGACWVSDEHHDYLVYAAEATPLQQEQQIMRFLLRVLFQQHLDAPFLVLHPSEAQEPEEALDRLLARYCPHEPAEWR